MTKNLVPKITSKKERFPPFYDLVLINVNLCSFGFIFSNPMDLAQSNEIFTIANESQQAFKACMAKKNS
jgi:hypothetical protein